MYALNLSDQSQMEMASFFECASGNLGLDLWKCVIYCDVSVCFVIYSSKIKFAEVSLAFLGGL